MVTTATIIMLNSSNGNIKLSLDKQGYDLWYQVHLLLPGIIRPLGAERLEYIASGLVSFLKEPERMIGLRSVLGLSERHTCFYGEYVERKAVLRMQDSDGNMFAKIELTKDERKQWIDVLSEYVVKYNE